MVAFRTGRVSDMTAYGINDPVFCPPTGVEGPASYAGAMNDALWEKAFARLVAGQRAPEVVWPQDRVRRIRGLSGDRIDDDDLPLRYCPESMQEGRRGALPTGVFDGRTVSGASSAARGG
jgi:hypothetical protein